MTRRTARCAMPSIRSSLSRAARACSTARVRVRLTLTLPGTSWGTLSERQKRLWDQLDCNTIDPELMRQKARS